MSQVDNLCEMEELGSDSAKIIRFNHNVWNHTNLMNAKCIHANLKYFNFLLPVEDDISNGSLLSC